MLNNLFYSLLMFYFLFKGNSYQVRNNQTRKLVQIVKFSTGAILCKILFMHYQVYNAKIIIILRSVEVIEKNIISYTN